MKIIGQSKNGYILAASRDEIARIAGFYSAYDDAFQKAMREIGVFRDGSLVEGASIPVGEMWQRLHDLRSREQQVRQTADSLRFLAKLIDDALPAIMPAPPADKGEPERPSDAA